MISGLEKIGRYTQLARNITKLYGIPRRTTKIGMQVRNTATGKVGSKGKLYFLQSKTKAIIT